VIPSGDKKASQKLATTEDVAKYRSVIPSGDKKGNVST
jgi:hypothetical protein